LGLGKPVLENRCAYHFRRRKTGITGQSLQKLHLFLGHPESVPEGTFLFFFFWRSCHFIDEQSELKAPGLFGGKRFGLTETWLAHRNKAYLQGIQLESCFFFWCIVLKRTPKEKKQT